MADVYDLVTLQRIETAAAKLLSRKATLNIQGRADLVVGTMYGDDEEVIKYYFADPTNEVVWWLEKVDVELVTECERAAVSSKHLGEFVRKV